MSEWMLGQYQNRGFWQSAGHETELVLRIQDHDRVSRKCPHSVMF